MQWWRGGARADSALADEPAAQGVDPLLDLFRAGWGPRRPAAGSAQRRVHGGVRLPGAPGPGADELVQLLAQGRDLAVRGHRPLGPGTGRLTRRLARPRRVAHPCRVTRRGRLTRPSRLTRRLTGPGRPTS